MEKKRKKIVDFVVLLYISFDLSCFCTDCCTFTCNSLKTRLNTSHRTSWSTRFTLQEKQTCIFLKYCFWRTAGVTSNIFFYVSEEQRNWKRLYFFIVICQWNELNSKVENFNEWKRTFSIHSRFVSIGIFLW